jgi:uncharacterized repeat protein (TIGR04076 family)
MTLEITHVGGTCAAGCKVGQTYDLSPIKTDNLCGTFYFVLVPELAVFACDGQLPYGEEKDKLEVRCPDYKNDVRGILTRELVGE